ncbi:hypothetical protein SUGI_0875010 [Cryptomeria japonica]|nr:hypothetical protein SUGI_0875010 [Cryptomeria japonica]
MEDVVKLHGKDLGPIVAGAVRKRLGPKLESLMIMEDVVKLHGKDLGPIVSGAIRKRLGPELEILMVSNT